MRTAILLSFCFLIDGLLPAQQVSKTPLTFAVATIKPSAPDAVAATQIRGNRFVTQGTTFVDVFKYAYNVHPEQVVGGPEWLRTKKFDILADPETEKRPSSDQMKAMVQQLLVGRFHLVMHHEQNILSVHALVKTAGTPKLTKSTADPISSHCAALRYGWATINEIGSVGARFTRRGFAAGLGMYCASFDSGRGV